MGAKRWAKAFTLVLTAALLAAACGGDDDAAPATTAGTDTTQAPDSTEPSESTTTSEAAQTPDGLTPIPDGIDLDESITMAYSAPPAGFDPDRVFSGYGPYIYSMYDRLTELTDDLEVVPLLATEWEYSADGTTFTMKLREDVVFHDGTPFNAEAVVANIERSKNLPGSTNAGTLTHVESVEAIGEFEVQFNLPEAKPANLPVILAGNAGAMIAPAFLDDEGDALNQGIPEAGSGPYKLVEGRIGERATYERAPNFWDPGRQLLAGLTVLYNDPTARINSVLADETDVAQLASADNDQALSLIDQGEFEGEIRVINSVLGMMFNPARGIFTNEKIRQAVNHAIDQDAINEGLFGGECIPQFQPFPAGSKYFHEDIEAVYSYDPDLARQLVEESGIEDPTFELKVSPGSYEQIVQVMQQQLEDVGITMNIVPGELQATTVDFLTGNTDALGLALVAAGDPGTLYQATIGGTFSVTRGPETPEGQAIAEAADAANDARLSEEEQIEAWHQVWLDFRELGSFVPACQTPQIWAHDDDVIGVEEMPWAWLGSRLPFTLAVLDD